MLGGVDTLPVGARELIFCLPCRLAPSRAPQGRREGLAWLALQRRARVRAWGCATPPPFQYCGHEGWAGVSADFQGPPPCRSGWPKWPPSSNSTNIKKKVALKRWWRGPVCDPGYRFRSGFFAHDPLWGPERRWQKRSGRGGISGILPGSGVCCLWEKKVRPRALAGVPN